MDTIYLDSIHTLRLIKNIGLFCLKKWKWGFLVSAVIFFSISPFPFIHIVSAYGLKDAAAALGNATLGTLLLVVANLLWELGVVLLAVAGTLFDSAIEFALDSSHFQTPGIKAGWGVFRDLANIAFIAVLVYIAIGTILQLGGVNTKRMLTTLIVIALLINFSFFFTGVIIDTSNILASLFYNEMAVPVTAQNAASLQGVDITGGRVSLSGQIAEGLQLSSMLDAKSAATLSNTQNGIATMLGAVALLIAAFVLLSGAILFIARIVVLMLSLVLAPLAFAAAILPATERYWKTWLNQLMGNAFVAPVYLLFFFVLFQIIESREIITLSKTNDTFAAAFGAFFTESGNYNEVSKVFLNYGIIIGLLLGIHMATKTIAGGISSLSVKWAGKATGLAAGGVGFIGRRTLGRGFAALSRSETLKNLGFDENNNARKGFGGFAARLALQSTEKGAKSTFDVRGGKIGEALGAGAGVLGTSFGGASGRGGFSAIEKAQIKRKVELGKSLGRTEKESVERAQEDAVRTAQDALSEEERKLNDALDKDPTRKAQLEGYRKSLQSAIKEGDADLISHYKSLVEIGEGTGLASAKAGLETAQTALKEITIARVKKGQQRQEAFAKKTEAERFNPLMGKAAKEAAADELRKKEGEMDKLLKKLEGLEKKIEDKPKP